MPDQSDVGTRWRVLAHKDTGPFEAHDEGVFDELVVDDWLHIEQMDRREWWMRIGDARVFIRIAEDGKATTDIERGVYEDCRGETYLLKNSK
jgi:hypothetical protein